MFIENYFFYFLVFILGASFASFLSVYNERGEDHKFFSAKNRSMCKNCLRKLYFFELIPVFSFLFLKGKCKTCKSKIPTKLFFGEVLLGIWFLSSYLYFYNIYEQISLIYVFLCWLLGAVFFLLVLEDIESMEISSRFLYFLLSIGIVMSILKFLNYNNTYEIIIPLLIFSPFWMIYFINDKWIGEADPYVFTALGLFFGTQFSISLFLYSIWFGAFFGLYYLTFIIKKIERNVPVPFLPIIFFSTLFILIFDYHIITISDILILNEIF